VAVLNGDYWASAPANPVISHAEVHVWHAVLDQPAARVQQLAQTLAADEQLRAGRFHFERDRLRFIVGRGLLRTILGRYLGEKPDELDFCCEPHGKPTLAKTIAGSGDTLQFNLSHSQGVALYAIACGRKVGVDIEHIRPIAEAEQIVDRFFSAQEQAVWRTLSVEQKQEAFFNAWTRKEAYLKANGNGLACPPDRVEVSLAPGEPARLLSLNGSRQATAGWEIRTLPVPGYAAALVVRGHHLQLKCWQWFS
jgi:4'-phosphopantetheinyl transferase